MFLRHRLHKNGADSWTVWKCICSFHSEETYSPNYKRIKIDFVIKAEGLRWIWFLLDVCYWNREDWHLHRQKWHQKYVRENTSSPSRPIIEVHTCLSKLVNVFLMFFCPDVNHTQTLNLSPDCGYNSWKGEHQCRRLLNGLPCMKVKHALHQNEPQNAYSTSHVSLYEGHTISCTDTELWRWMSIAGCAKFLGMNSTF